ncbi:hypothetical protein BTO06_09940 [Tenacibaculum sp. SZ-18]|uniref:hypothetical protein n=1 Tax=Tenacibaculum sp. SZ-18 TaxID=754423 RepID=UPI000C2D00D3|nr:hypothetical protein [Tenacibaculum sp. SZ-18]AUC15441.1 hypothetical protein BTO06_09940 [Tenacibaculum sp. SZ-18]
MKLLQIIKNETEVFMERLLDMKIGEKIKFKTLLDLELFSEKSGNPPNTLFDMDFKNEEFILTKLCDETGKVN